MLNKKSKKKKYKEEMGREREEKSTHACVWSRGSINHFSHLVICIFLSYLFKQPPPLHNVHSAPTPDSTPILYITRSRQPPSYTPLFSAPHLLAYPTNHPLPCLNIFVQMMDILLVSTTLPLSFIFLVLIFPPNILWKAK